MNVLNSFITTVFVCFSFILVGQKTDYYPIRGTKGEALIVIDSLSYKQDYFLSAYYVDSISKIPYTGKAVEFHGINSIDSFEVSNGYLNGWVKSFMFIEKKWALFRLAYYNQSENIFVSTHISSEFEPHSAFIKFEVKHLTYFAEIIYKKKKIIVKQTITTKERKEIRKIKFNSLLELEEHLKNFEPPFVFCKQAGFFGKAEIE